MKRLLLALLALASTALAQTAPLRVVLSTHRIDTNTGTTIKLQSGMTLEAESGSTVNLTAPTLQLGNITPISVTIGASSFIDGAFTLAGMGATVSVQGDAGQVADFTDGKINLSTDGLHTTTIGPTASANRTIDLPDASGTLLIDSQLGSGIATFLATPSSANLAAAVTNETGTGLLVFATSPSLTTPLLGTPTSGTLTNCTGYPVASLANLGTGVATALAAGATNGGNGAADNGKLVTFGTVGNLIGASGLTLFGDGVGSSAVVLYNSASTHALTIAVAGTGVTNDWSAIFPNSNTYVPVIMQPITVSGPSAARTWTVPDASFSLARIDAAQSIAGVQTFTDSTDATSTTTGSVKLAGGIGVAKAIYSGTFMVVNATNGLIGIDPSNGTFNDITSGTHDFGAWKKLRVRGTELNLGSSTDDSVIVVKSSNGVSIGSAADPGAGALAVAGDISTDTAGKTLKVKSGSNAKAGTFTLVVGAATVTNSSVTANSVIQVTLKTVGGTRTGNPDIVPTATTGFVATGAATDTSTYNYVILEVN